MKWCTPHLSKLQNWSLTIRLYPVISWTLVGRQALLLYGDVMSIFYSPRQLGCFHNQVFPGIQESLKQWVTQAIDSEFVLSWLCLINVLLIDIINIYIKTLIILQLLNNSYIQLKMLLVGSVFMAYQPLLVI